ncbi:hypothetical protein K449DRAFT_470066 [Hypoxylon sp. EC38]|nr:hypothetical protein K449DRAFT_470066 [Hypoxylon sp. EC38]
MTSSNLAVVDRVTLERARARNTRHQSCKVFPTLKIDQYLNTIRLKRRSNSSGERPDSETEHYGTGQPAHQNFAGKPKHGRMYSDQFRMMPNYEYFRKNIVFPFAVYEAKKSSGSDTQAEKQAAGACDRYLGIIDQVVRDPRNSKKYQWKNSRDYQIFAFTSRGPR